MMNYAMSMPIRKTPRYKRVEYALLMTDSYPIWYEHRRIYRFERDEQISNTKDKRKRMPNY